MSTYRHTCQPHRLFIDNIIIISRFIIPTRIKAYIPAHIFCMLNKPLSRCIIFYVTIQFIWFSCIFKGTTLLFYLGYIKFSTQSDLFQRTFSHFNKHIWNVFHVGRIKLIPQIKLFCSIFWKIEHRSHTFHMGGIQIFNSNQKWLIFLFVFYWRK